jgi:hypothetical protein
MTNVFALWSCFAAVITGLLVLVRQSWRFYGGSGFVAKLLLGWFAVALILGLYAMLTPGLRLPTWSLPVVVISLTVTFNIVILNNKDMREHAEHASLNAWFRLQFLRAYFGGVIVIGGILDLLPWQFALAAGVGDLVVGWVAMLLTQFKRIPKPVLWGFVIFGVADLINAGRLGGVMVVPWLVERQLPGFLVMIPLMGVPMMLAAHLQMARWQLIKRHRTIAGSV